MHLRCVRFQQCSFNDLIHLQAFGIFYSFVFCIRSLFSLLTCKQLTNLYADFCADIRLYVLTLGHTGRGHQQRECSGSSNTLATNQTSTRWEGTNCIRLLLWDCVVLLGPQNICCLLMFYEIFVSPLNFSRTKIFIRHPRTLFATEDAFEVCKHELGKAPATSDKRIPWRASDYSCNASFDLIGWHLKSFLLQPQEFRPNTKAIGLKETTWGRKKQVFNLSCLKN